MEKLVEHIGLLTDLIDLDPRGGFFGQKSMYESVKLLCEHADFKSGFATWLAHMKNDTGTKEPMTIDRLESVKLDPAP